MRINNFTKLLILIPFIGINAQKGCALDWNLQTEPINKGTIKQTEIGLTLFKTIDAKIKLTNIFSYKSTTITDELKDYLLKDYATNYSSTHFNTYENNFEFSKQLNDKTRLTFGIQPTLNFENHITFSDVMLLGSIEINYNINKNSSVDFGIKRTTLFGTVDWLPTFTYNHQFNEHVYIKLGFPKSSFSFSNSIRNKFSINNDFNGCSYNLDEYIINDDLNTVSKVGFSQMETTLQLARNMDKSWIITAKGGYSTNKEFKFSDNNKTYEINQKQKNGSLFSISIKYKI
ncbi:DUF6268 family outer membrane beta-barrel protein [Flavobacterium sp. IMCC34518]|uniref:DUF6268 family outer membrane beta-barrel protein n=1 Tax=Flavobacterium sp. IMCC34518 TaxID=3003623 RepID=UPI0022AC7461|nr:DUF6268 family outer membrane beta-barrel protein [Flavobacterium sp. IMCC34518]